MPILPHLSVHIFKMQSFLNQQRQYFIDDVEIIKNWNEFDNLFKFLLDYFALVVCLFFKGSFTHLDKFCKHFHKYVISIILFTGFWRSGPSREPIPDHRRPVWRRRSGVGLHHPTLLTNRLHPGGRTRPRNDCKIFSPDWLNLFEKH